MIRAFIAIEIDPKTVQKIASAIDQLKPRIPEIRWVSQTNFHLTLKFLGDVGESKIEPIGTALEQDIHPFPRFTINAKGLGVFPDVKRPRILWAGFEGDRLAGLAWRVETALTRQGFAPEIRAFKEHLTVGRWRQFKGSPAKLEDELARWKRQEFGQSSVDEIILFQSVLKPEGASYHRLKVVKLGNE